MNAKDELIYKRNCLLTDLSEAESHGEGAEVTDNIKALIKDIESEINRLNG